MPMKHEEIQSVLPEYLSEGLPPAVADEVKTHIASCVDCQDELTVLVELQRFSIAEPGELFWKTLPGRVAAEARAGRPQKERLAQWVGWLWRPMPLAGAALLLAILIFARFGSSPVVLTESAYIGSYNFGLSDYESLAEADIPDIDLDGEAAAALVQSPEGLSGYDYYREFMALTPNEIEKLYRTLNKDNPRGG